MSIKDLVNNPWFVAGLSAIALLYLLFSVALPLLGENDDLAAGSSAAVPPLDMLAESMAAPAYSDTQSYSRHALGNRAQIEWLDDIPRDPFKMPKVGPVKQDTRTQSKRKLVLPKLTALFVGNGVEAAVVNEKLLKVGDSIDGFSVTKIDTDRILLERDRKTYTLEPGHE